MTRLEFERRRRCWNQTDLAYHSRITQGEVSRLERGRMTLTPTYAGRLAKALGVPADVLLSKVPTDQMDEARA